MWVCTCGSALVYRIHIAKRLLYRSYMYSTRCKSRLLRSSVVCCVRAATVRSDESAAEEIGERAAEGKSLVPPKPELQPPLLGESQWESKNFLSGFILPRDARRREARARGLGTLLLAPCSAAHIISDLRSRARSSLKSSGGKIATHIYTAHANCSPRSA